MNVRSRFTSHILRNVRIARPVSTKPYHHKGSENNYIHSKNANCSWIFLLKYNFKIRLLIGSINCRLLCDEFHKNGCKRVFLRTIRDESKFNGSDKYWRVPCRFRRFNRLAISINYLFKDIRSEREKLSKRPTLFIKQQSAKN